MQLYQCKVRLMGLLTNEVFKPEVSAPEIMLLRAFHGDDAVVDITETRVSGIANDAERERLLRIYMNQKSNNVEQIKGKQNIWFGLFGPMTASLPTKLPGEYPKLPDDTYKPDKRGKRQVQAEAAAAESAENPLE
jgi:hypothetical protein